MKIFLIGFRRGLVDELERRNLSYVVVAEKVKMHKLRGILVSKKIPQQESEIPSFVESYSHELAGVTHVIAAGEGGVVAANWFRKALDLAPLPDDLIRACSDKLFMKRVLSRGGIPVTQFIGGDEGLDSSQIIRQLGPKIVMKELNNSGGKGQKILKNESEFLVDSSFLYERYIEGAQEMSVESFVQGSEIVLTSTTQYYEKETINIVPAQIDRDVVGKVLSLNSAVLKKLGIQSGMTHLEVYLLKDRVLFGEVALRPPGGYIMNLIEKATGLNPWELYLDLNLGKTLKLKALKTRSAAALILHPGAGTCQAIHGTEKVESLKSFDSMRVRGKVGEVFSHRDGVGQEKAHILLSNSEPNKLLEDVITARRDLIFTLI